jgi:hypothetical protein
MAYDSNGGRTVVFGGEGVNDVVLGDTWQWDGSVWTQVADFGATPSVFTALAFKGDSVALFGGATPSTPVQVFGTTWTWDGRHWTLRQDIGPGPRWHHAMAYDSKRSHLVLFGGSATTEEQNSVVADNTMFSFGLGDTWEHSEGTS